MCKHSVRRQFLSAGLLSSRTLTRGRYKKQKKKNEKKQKKKNKKKIKIIK